MEIEGLFEKYFVLKCEHRQVDWQLPEIKLDSENQHLKDEKVKNLKSELNSVKGSLNDFEIEDWHKHTTYCNPASNVQGQIKHYFRPELCTQAWCKFYEILVFDQVLPDFALSSKLVSAVHICEAPGAFICCLNHYLKSNYENVEYKWLASTLNPYYEGNDAESCVADDRLIFRTSKQWCFGPDNTGDIFSKSLLKDLSKRAATFEKVCLVTADGSVNCQKNPAQQEMDTSRLKFTELLYALSILDVGGSFVLKIFTPLEYTSIQLLYILCCTFERVKIRKPATSKPGNSELYVAATGYKKLDSQHTLLIALRQLCFEGGESARIDLFSTNALPNDFVYYYKSCVETFVQYQINAIKYNIERYNNKDAEDLDELHQKVVRMAFDKMGVWYLPYEQRIIRRGDLTTAITSNITLRPRMSGTFMGRRIIFGVLHNTWAQYLEWTSHKFVSYDVEFLFGKPLQAIKTSLFCETGLLMSLYRLDSQPTHWDHHGYPNYEEKIASCLKEMISTGNGQVYEAELWVNGKTCAEILGLAGHECSRSSPLKLSSPVILGAGSVLLASLLQPTQELDITREAKCMNQFMKLVSYVLQNSRPGANMLLLLPSALTRLTAALFLILRDSYRRYVITTVDKVTPCIIMFLSDFTEVGIRIIILLVTVVTYASQAKDDHSLLGILSVEELLKDRTFVDVMKKSNHRLVEALQQRRQGLGTHHASTS